MPQATFHLLDSTFQTDMSQTNQVSQNEVQPFHCYRSKTVSLPFIHALHCMYQNMRRQGLWHPTIRRVYCFNLYKLWESIVPLLDACTVSFWPTAVSRHWSIMRRDESIQSHCPVASEFLHNCIYLFDLTFKTKLPWQSSVGVKTGILKKRMKTVANETCFKVPKKSNLFLL